MKITSTQAIKRLISHLPSRRRQHIVLLALLMLLGGISEIASLGLIVPFLAFLIDPLQALQVPIVSWVTNSLQLGVDPDDLRWKFTILFCAAAITSGAIRLLLAAFTARVVFGIGYELGVEVYRRAIFQPYEVHTSRNSSDIIGGLNKVEPLVFIIYGLINAASSILIAIFIFLTLMVISASFTGLTIVALGGLYAALMLLLKKKLSINSKIIDEAINERVKITQEGLGSIRDILLDHSQGYFIDRFSVMDKRFRLAQASNLIIGPSPRFAVEAIGMVLIALFAYISIASSDGLTSVIPALGAMALGAQRLLPLVQLIYIGVVNLKGQENLVIDVIELLEQPVNDEAENKIDSLNFNDHILFDKVNFRFHKNSPLVLEDLSFLIKKGNRIGFLGPTGSGKSTTIDLLIGLLMPTSGRILVDDKLLTGKTCLEWQKNIAHVPQDLYLLDASFARNIAFSVPESKIDLGRVIAAAKSAQIHEFISETPKGYDGVVGERGTRLSGGQRQRIGIARALYKKTSVLVLDEATSALDSDSEKEVMSSIQGIDGDITIIMIAHRVSTLKHCDIVYRLDGGKITDEIDPISIK